ncbi:hypothetical protein STEG23_011778 [Scotinomys teguina]
MGLRPVPPQLASISTPRFSKVPEVTPIHGCTKQIRGYLKSISGSYSDKWKSSPACADVRTTCCVFPQDAFHTGTFFLRVQASDGDSTSFWSEEKFINSQKYSGEDLEPPEDVDIYIIDDNYTLKWSSRESVGNVTFSAEYQTEEMEDWLKLPGCQHITGTECNFSLLDTNIYIKTSFRVRAEKGKNTSPWSEVDPFVPFHRAHIGPPGVRLEAEDKALLVYITRPGHGGNMWSTDNFSFRYKIVIWQKSSGVTQIINTTYYTERILKLLPETTYCLKVGAIHLSLRKHSNYSAVQCINTTVAGKMPVPENIQVAAAGESYVLRWDYASPNVSFRAQWLPGYLKSISGSYSDKWKPIPACADVRTTRCVFPQDAFHTGTFFLRVQASDGDSTSFWSEEKFINSQKYTAFPPPVVAVTPSRDSLLVYVSCQDSSSTKCLGLTYEISFWKNTSNTKRKMVKESPEFTIGNLQPQTVYCVQARVLSLALWNKSSSFSDKLCEETRPGLSPPIKVSSHINHTAALLYDPGGGSP